MPYKKAFGEQVTALQKATQAAFDEIAKEINDKAVGGVDEATKAVYKFKIIKAGSTITGYEIPEGYELQLDRGLAIQLKTPIHIYAANLNEFAWITCDLVAETLVGERAIRLLTPTPIKMFTGSVAKLEYVPVKMNRFAMIELHLFSNMKTLEVLQAPHNLLLVLHFRPTHKRKGVTYDGDPIKRHCCDNGCRGRVLQQTADWRWRNASDAWNAAEL